MLLILTVLTHISNPTIISIEFVFSFVRFSISKTPSHSDDIIDFLECSIFSNDGMIDFSIVRISHVEMVEWSNYLLKMVGILG